MATATATHLLLHNLLLRRPIRLSTAAATIPFSLLRHHPILSFSLLPTRSLSSSSLPINSAVLAPNSLSQEQYDDEPNELEDNERGGNSSGVKAATVVEFESERKIPKLTVAEKKALGSYANSLGDKLKSQQVGKSGVTENVVFAINETLEANELLKLKIHRTCPGELDDVVRQLEQATGSVVVGQIGRTVIFYRPSLTKLKAEEKKEQARRLFAQKKQKAQSAFMTRKRDQLTRRPGQSYHGSRKVEKMPL